MTCLLNEEIRAIQTTITHLKKGMTLEPNQSKRERMKKDIIELESILNSKLRNDTDYEH